jgi:predicted secreted protein
MKKLFITILCLLCGSVFAESKSAETNTTIAIKQGQTSFQIRLKSNRTTGYAWYLGKCSRGIKPSAMSYIASQTKLMGAPGMSVWTFDLNKKALDVPRVLKVSLVYMRPWDASTMEKKTFYVVTGS